MSIKSLFFVLFTVGCGCSSSVAGEPALKSLARGMSQGYPAVDLQMTMTWTRRGDQEYLHCRLRNVAAYLVEIDARAAPWRNYSFIDWTALTAKGEVVYKTGAVEGAGSIRTERVSLHSGQVLEGDIELNKLPDQLRVRRVDLLLMWNADVGIIGGPPLRLGPVTVSGVTFLPRSKTDQDLDTRKKGPASS